MGKKTKKPGKGKEKTEKKTAKAEEKKARRESKKISPEDDIDAILLSIQKEEAKKKEVHVEENVHAPSPRSNCSLTVNPLKETELILYGGEFYNGNKTFVYGDLLRYDVEKQEWKSISSPNSPPPRSAHQAVAWKNYLYIYGGEFTSPNQERFHHYKDFWVLDLKTNQWEQLNYKGCPSPRSGHRMSKEIVDVEDHPTMKRNVILHSMRRWTPTFINVELSQLPACCPKEIVDVEDHPTIKSNVILHSMRRWMWDAHIHQCGVFAAACLLVLYKHKIIIFGGFYDTLREVRYFNDLNVFDLDQYKWQEIKPRLGCMWPSPRSGFQFFVYQDEIYMYGGYSKEVLSSDKKVSEKGIVHSDIWCLDPRTWEWNKIKKSGMPPGPRAGFSMCVHKKRALLFGGVVDMEMEGDLMMSLFLNEIYGFQLDNHRWYPLELRKEKATKNKLKSNSDENINRVSRRQNAVSSDEDEDSDNDDVDMDGDIKKMSVNLHKNVSVSDSVEGSGSNKNLVQNSILPEIVKPCGRINSCMVVGKDTLYIYGGMMEIKDREITLDDLYALNLSKLDEWKCIIPASESEWVETSDNEDEGEDENEEEDEDEDGDSGSEDDSDKSDDEDVDMEDTSGDATLSLMGDAVAVIKGEAKNLRRKDKRARIEQIRVSLGLSDSQRTPTPGESLKDFYRRTNMYWQMAAYEHTQHTGKELRKDGFDLAKGRYKELKPILDELAILEAEQKAEEEEAPESSSSRKKSGRKTKLSAAK